MAEEIADHVYKPHMDGEWDEADILMGPWGDESGGAGVLSCNEKRVRDSELVKWIFNTEAEMIRKSPVRGNLN